MKGCLKLSPMPSPIDTHHNDHNGGARCFRTSTSTSTSTPTAPSSPSTPDTASKTPTQAHTQAHRKCVAFCAEGSETVYTADEWDRTPAEPARKLSYQDLLELKEIQRSLPHANQPPDAVTGRPGKQFLSGVPIVLLPLLSSAATPSGGGSGDGAQEAEAKKPCISSNVAGRTNGNSWGPPSLPRQAQTTPARPSFPFPPRPIPFSVPTSSVPTSPARTNFQSQKPSPPFSPTFPYPSSYSNHPSAPSNRPSIPSTPATYPYSNFQQQPPRTQVQTQPWTPPPSLTHLMPSLPIKPREKPKFEFLTLLDSSTRTNGSAAVASGGVDGVEVATTKVGTPEVPVDPISNVPSGLIERENHDEEHDLEEHDQDHDVISVSSSSSCPSLCTSCPSSCSASEVDTDHEHEHESEMETERRYFSPNGYPGFDLDRYAVDSDARDWRDDARLVRPTRTTANNFDLGVGFLLDEKHKAMKKKPELKKKERKFILVNDMEIELDDSDPESDEEEDALSGMITSTTTTETTTTTTTRTTTTEKTTTTTTTTSSSGRSPSPRSVMSPVPVKSTLWGSHPPLSPSSASLITPPTTPPVEQVVRNGSINNKPLPSTLSPSRGRMKASQKIGHVVDVDNSTSRERSGSLGSDTNGAGGMSPSRNPKTRIGSPAKLKSKML